MPNTYLPSGEQERALWLTNFAKKLDSYVTVLGLTSASAAAVVADAAYYSWTIQVLLLYRDYAQAWTAFKNDLSAGTQLGAAPPVPNIPVAPTAVAPNILGRLGKLVATIKNAPGYTDAIGQDLGIVGPEASKSPAALEDLKPVLVLALIAKGLNIGWTKQGNRRLNLWLEVDRGDGAGWVFLALDTEPDYIDTRPVAAPAVWQYRAQYRLGDEPVGHWSDVARQVVG